jgi:uncharacterized 2Fe-2S/4Fe-4S cluster protein (DUF4445 family)
LEDIHGGEGDDVGRAVLNVARELGEWGRNVLGGLEKNI